MESKMKKQLLFLALTLGTHISAETIIDALNELDGSAAQEFLGIVNSLTIPEFQAKNLKTLNTQLSANINTITHDQIAAIDAQIDKVVNTIFPLLKATRDYKDTTSEEFEELANRTKVELQKIIEKAIQQATLEKLAQEAEQKRLVEEALTSIQVAPVLLSTEESTPTAITPSAPDMMNTQVASETQNDRLAQLAEELSSLDETSSSDPVDKALLAHSDILEDFMTERMPTLNTTTKQDYQSALDLFFKTQNLEIDYQTLSALADRLYTMQTMYYEQVEEDEIDALLALLTAEEITQLAQEIEHEELDARIKKTAAETARTLETLLSILSEEKRADFLQMCPYLQEQKSIEAPNLVQLPSKDKKKSEKKKRYHLDLKKRNKAAGLALPAPVKCTEELIPDASYYSSTGNTPTPTGSILYMQTPSGLQTISGIAPKASKATALSTLDEVD